MSKGNTFENDLLKAIFQATAIANIVDNAAASPLTNLYFSLHNADVGEAGSQTTNETAYTSYARVAVARSAGGFTVTNNSVSPAANVDFPEATAGTDTLTHWAVGTASSGTGKVLYKGALGSKMGLFTATTADVITIPGHTLSVNDRVALYDIDDQAVPTGITAGTAYYVKTVSGNDITISTTQGGATLDITAVGAGIAFKVTPISVAVGVIPRIKSTTTIKEN